MKVTITWNDTEELIVDGTYYKARPMSNDRINPPEDADFEIHTIEYKGVEVQNLFSDDDFYTITEKYLTLIS
ncbi:hypothetical protein UFOVP212_34 [uncultured Caudovirales phage]|uniref:Uncharacterized protein n=1 Tax=uncultured Caudovirales phage TaxID=2100421 RepID=A0A6J7WK93_9CAUD|nr:hypothetical protein UFOVP212_34 [uncultured Caudovirales phage]